MNKIASRAARGAVFLSLSTISNIVIGFVGGIFLARLIAPNDFGTFALVTSASAFVNLRAFLQLEPKFLRDRDESTAHLDTYFSLSLGLTGIALIGMLALAGGALYFHRLDLAICLTLVGIFNLADPLTTTLRLSLEKQVVFGGVALSQSLSSLTQYGLTLLAALAGWGLWSLLLGQLTNMLFNLIVLWRIAPRRPRWNLDRRLGREFLAYGLKYGLVSAVCSTILVQGDNLALGVLGGTYALGFYDRAYRTSSWPTILISAALGRISLPAYSQLRDEPERLRRAFSLVLWFVFTFTTPLGLALFLTAPELVPVLYGAQWAPAIPILRVLAAFAVCRPLWDDMISIFIATGRPGQMARMMFYQTVVFIALVIPLTWWQGAVGTALSAGAAFLISAGYLLYFARRELGVDLWKTAGLPVLNNALMVGAYFLVRALWPLTGWPLAAQLALEAALAAGLYLAFSLLTSRQVIYDNLHFLWSAVRAPRPEG